MFSIAGGFPARVTFPETVEPPVATAGAAADAVVAPDEAGAAVPVAAGALPASNDGASSFEPPPHPTAIGSARTASHKSLELSFMKLLLKSACLTCEICHKGRML